MNNLDKRRIAIEKLKKILENQDVIDLLKGLKHPQAHLVNSDLTFWYYAEYIMNRSGTNDCGVVSQYKLSRMINDLLKKYSVKVDV